MKILSLCLLGACWSAPVVAPPPPKPAAPPVKPLEFGVLAREGFSVLRVANHRFETVAHADPLGIAMVTWSGHYAGTGYFSGQTTVAIFDGEQFTDLSDRVWRSSNDPYGEAKLITNKKLRELYVGHCASRGPDGYEWQGQCEQWEYARIAPGVFEEVDEAAIDPDLDLPSDRPKIALVGITAKAGTYDTDGTCVDRHGTHVLEPAERGGSTEVRALVADPPIFALDTSNGSGFGPGYTVTVMYEGCTKSTRYADGAFGPDGVVALYGKDFAVYQHGKLLARAVDLDVTKVAFGF